MTLECLLKWGREELSRSGVPEAELGAWYLLQACFGTDFGRNDYFLRKDEEVSEEQQRKYTFFVEKRKKRIPLEYITGYTEFMGLPFFVDENVLIPRQDTETLVETVYPVCRGKRVLDLCTGSGCIGLSIGVLGNPSRLVLSDISEAALCVAGRNLEQFRTGERWQLSAETELVCSDLFEQVEGMFDCIVSNPPYIETETISGLMPEVGEFEPKLALDGGGDGLHFYRRIIRSAPSYLEDGGILCFEIGYDQGEAVCTLMRENNFEKVEIRKDLAGNDRVVLGMVNRGKG